MKIEIIFSLTKLIIDDVNYKINFFILIDSENFFFFFSNYNFFFSFPIISIVVKIVFNQRRKMSANGTLKITLKDCLISKKIKDLDEKVIKQ